MARLLVLLLLPLFFTGCATSASDPGLFTHVTSEKTGLLQQGPGQTTPPDQYLEAGTRVHLINVYGDYVQVETVRGDRGWVKSSDVVSAPD